MVEVLLFSIGNFLLKTLILSKLVGMIKLKFELKKVNYLLATLLVIFVLSGCSSTSRTSVDPWPGLFRLKETNKKGYENQKKRNKKLKKMNKKRLNTLNYPFFEELEPGKLA